MMKTLVCLALVAIPTWVLAGTSQDCAQDKNYDLRIRACSDIIGRYGRSAAWAYVNRGNAYSEMGDQDRAITDFTTAIWINPREVEAYNSRGLAHNRKGDCDLAIADFNRAMQISPGNPAHYNNRGIAYQCKQDYDQAFADYNRALAINPRNAPSYINRGRIYLRKGEYEWAIADYNKSSFRCSNRTSRPAWSGRSSRCRWRANSRVSPWNTITVTAWPSVSMAASASRLASRRESWSAVTINRSPEVQHDDARPTGNRIAVTVQHAPVC